VLCCAVLQGTLEMLTLDGNYLNGTVPPCLFNDNSTLYYVSSGGSGASYWQPSQERSDSNGAQKNGAVRAVEQCCSMRVDVGCKTPLQLSAGAVPYCLQFSASVNNLTGSLPDAFVNAKRLQLLNLAGVRLLDEHLPHMPQQACRQLAPCGISACFCVPREPMQSCRPSCPAIPGDNPCSVRCRTT